MNKKAYYFSHDSNARHDEKIIKLRMKLGWEGYGIYWAIIEMLRDAKNYRLENDYESIAFELRTECERIASVVNDYNLFIVNDEYFYSESLIKRMDLKESKSKQAREAAKKRWSKSIENQKDVKDENANLMRPHSDSNAIKRKESKVKENNNIDYVKFVEFFNSTTGRSIRVTDTLKKLIKSRLNDGYTKDDLIHVVRVKSMKWKSDPKMYEYLHPNTLFAKTNFEKYIDEKLEEAPKKEKIVLKRSELMKNVWDQ